MSENRIVGCVTWFDSKKGYGFVKVLTPNHENNDSDIFIHFSNIQVSDNEYKVVYPGEYVEFDLSQSEDDYSPMLCKCNWLIWRQPSNSK